MDNNALVSIIIPTFNRAKYISKAINSCLNQTYENIEIIIVDDCSTQNYKIVLEKLKDKRIRYFKNSQNKGGCYSRNRGIEESRGKFINFLDDDDTLHPEKIKLQIQQFNDSKINNLGVVTCDVKYNRKDISTIKKNRGRGNIYVNLLKSYCVFATHSMLIKREVFNSVKYDLKLQSSQEYDLMIQMSRKFNFDYVPKILAYVYESENQISFNFDKKIHGTRYLYTKHLKEFKRNNVYMYNFLRFHYLFFKYRVGKYLGLEVYTWLP